LLDNLLGSAMPGGAGSTAKPIGMALLGLLAAHALKGRGQPADGSSYDPQGGFLPQRPEDIPPEQQPGLLEGGLSGLLQRFQQSGYGDLISSWIGGGQNRPIAPDELHQALGPEMVNDLSRQTGLRQPDLLSQLAQQLPQFIDRLTPQGRIPERSELMRG